ncbi:MAG: hypothetical protein HY302_11210 [Opitutae bacterium]|nr:hypothetical protein [Opitutae bacterium]
MALKIKWNDDRVRGATTAILLIGRERLHRGETTDLIQASLADYRADPERYKKSKAAWADAKELGPLTNPRHVAYFRNLLSAVARLAEKMTQAKRQFNSLRELDNYLVASLGNVR